MAYSYAVQVFSTASNQVSVPFPFLARGHVTLKIDGIVVPPSSYTWLNDGMIQLATFYPGGTTTRVFRTTPIDDPLVIFEPGFVDPKDLNDSTLQLLYASQEAIDEAGAATEISGDILDYYEQMVTLASAMNVVAGQVNTTYANFLDLVSRGAALHIDIAIPNSAYGGTSLPTDPTILMAFVAPFNATMSAQSITNWTAFTTDITHPISVFQFKEFNPATGALSASPIAELTFPLDAREGIWTIQPAPFTKNKLYALVCVTAGNNMTDLYGSIELVPNGT